MTAYASTVNIEALIVAMLRDANVADGNVHAERISDTLPFVLVESAGGAPRSSRSPGWVQRPDVQIDAWAETKGAARDAIDSVSLTLRTYPRTKPNWPQGVITGAEVPEPIFQGDDEILVGGNPAPRYLLVATFTVHP